MLHLQTTVTMQMMTVLVQVVQIAHLARTLSNMMNKQFQQLQVLVSFKISFFFAATTGAHLYCIICDVIFLDMLTGGKGKATPGKKMLPKSSGNAGNWNVTTRNVDGRKKKGKVSNGAGDEETDSDEPSRPGVTTYRKVRSKRGYSSYPAYLFDIPPAKLSIENLRRQFLIAEIERSKAEKNYYSNACNFMNFVKTKAQTLIDKNGLQLNLAPKVKVEEGDHGYAMNSAVVIDDEGADIENAITIDLSQAEIIPSSQLTLVTSGPCSSTM